MRMHMRIVYCMLFGWHHNATAGFNGEAGAIVEDILLCTVQSILPSQLVGREGRLYPETVGEEQ